MVLDQILNLFEEGESTNSFGRCLAQTEKIIYGSTDEVKTRMLHKSYEIGIHSLVDDAGQNYFCKDCPAPLEPGK